jgi:hypothetical protein
MVFLQAEGPLNLFGHPPPVHASQRIAPTTGGVRLSSARVSAPYARRTAGMTIRIIFLLNGEADQWQPFGTRCC